jgi:magnesium transporter
MSIHSGHDGSPTRYRTSSLDSVSEVTPRNSPPISRSFNPMDPDARERQRTLDVDMALHLSRARHGSVSVSPATSPRMIRELNDPEPATHCHHEESIFPTLFPQEERELEIARGGTPRQTRSIDGPYRRTLTPDNLRLALDMEHHLTPNHESHLLGSLEHHFDGTLPLYQPSVIHGRQTFDFETMEYFAKAEKKRLGLLNSPADERPQVLRTRKPSQASANGDVGSSGGNVTDFRLPAPRTFRERKLSQSNALPRRHGGGKMALFEGLPGAPPASLSAGLAPPPSAVPSYADLPVSATGMVGHDRPYRFSFYSNALSATIHARSLSELPADGQSFEDMFSGIGGPAAPQERRTSSGSGPQLTSRSNRVDAKIPNVGNGGEAHKPLLADFEGHTWWLDILSPTDEEMKMLSKVRNFPMEVEV